MITLNDVLTDSSESEILNFEDSFAEETGIRLRKALALKEDEIIVPESSMARTYVEEPKGFAALVRGPEGVRRKVIVDRIGAKRFLDIPKNIKYSVLKGPEGLYSPTIQGFYLFADVPVHSFNLNQIILRPPDKFNGTAAILEAVGKVIKDIHDAGYSYPNFTPKSLLLSTRPVVDANGNPDPRFANGIISLLRPENLEPYDPEDPLQEINHFLLSTINTLKQDPNFADVNLDEMLSLYRSYMGRI